MTRARSVKLNGDHLDFRTIQAFSKDLGMLSS